MRKCWQDKDEEIKQRFEWDNYFVLSVSRDFTPEELKKSYRKR